MRWKHAIAGASLVLLATTACGAQVGAGGDAAGSRPSSSREPVLPEPTKDDGTKASPPVQEMPGRKPAQPPDQLGDAIPPGQLDANALPKGYPRDVGVRNGGTTLAVVAQEGGCGQASVEIAAQNAQRVALTLVETTPSDPNTMCTMDMRYPVLTVQLEQPLDGRTVVLDSERRKG